MTEFKRQILKVYKTRRAIRAGEEAARKEKQRQRDIELLLSGDARRVYEETGVDLLAGTEFSDAPAYKPPHHGASDAGAGRDELNESTGFDSRSPSETLSDHIRAVWNDPERRKERDRLKRGGSHDARDVPEDAPAAVSYPRVPWER